MADEDGELPMYIEDEEEDAAVAMAAAEREKRRAEGAEWGMDKIREKFMERHHAKLRAYEEERSKYPRPPPRRLDPEEESPEPPMRYLSLGRGGPQLASSANIISIRVVRCAIGYPIHLYGTVFVRDELDGRRVCVFRRDRDNCQLISSKDESLFLTGPYRGLLIFNSIYFEIDLKCKDCEAGNDRKLGKWCLKDSALASTLKPIRNRFVGKSCAIDLTYVPAHRAVEVSIEFRICEVLRIREKPNGSTVEEWLPFNKKRKEHSEFHGSIVTSIDGFPKDIVLYDSKAAGSVIGVDDGGLLEVPRHVFAVPIDRAVLCKIASHGDRHAFKALPGVSGGSSSEVIVGPYSLEIKFVWSALFSPKDDGMPHWMRGYSAAEGCRGRYGV